MCPSEAMKILQFSHLICTIWCIHFGTIPKKRRKYDNLDDSPFSENLNRIDTVAGYYTDPILTSQSVLCNCIFSGLFCLFFFPASSLLLSLPFIIFDNSQGVFYTHNTSFPFALLSFSFPFLLFSFSSLSFLTSLPFPLALTALLPTGLVLDM